MKLTRQTDYWLIDWLTGRLVDEATGRTTNLSADWPAYSPIKRPINETPEHDSIAGLIALLEWAIDRVIILFIYLVSLLFDKWLDYGIIKRRIAWPVA